MTFVQIVSVGDFSSADIVVLVSAAPAVALNILIKEIITLNAFRIEHVESAYHTHRNPQVGIF